jgi:hypothetical protein
MEPLTGPIPPGHGENVPDVPDPVRDEHEWRVWVCADCEDNEGPPAFWLAHSVVAGSVPNRTPDIDECPRCGARGSFVPQTGYVVLVSVDGRKAGP